MKRFAIPLATLIVLAATGCTSVQMVKAPQSELASLKGKKLTVITYTKADFTAFTAGKATFGLLGAAAMVHAGNKLVAEDHIADPAITIADEVSAHYQAILASSQVSRIDNFANDAPSALAQAAGGKGLVLDVRTLNWMFNYFPASWSHYHVTYGSRMRLIDASTGRVISQVPCSYATDNKAATAPTYDQLTANGGTLLKSKLAEATAACTKLMDASVFSG